MFDPREFETNFDAVIEWHRAFGAPIGDAPALIPKKRADLRIELIREEFEEVKEGIAKGDLVEIADGLGDLLWVVYGAAVEYGIPIQEVFEEISLSNFSKLGRDGKPILREDGKILKGPDFFKPDIASILGVEPSE